jgi:DUF4097 and DUF4098 domain-containing protein YvlB
MNRLHTLATVARLALPALAMPVFLTGCISVNAGGCASTVPGTRTISAVHEATKPVVVRTQNGQIEVVQSAAATDVSIVADIRARDQQRLDQVQLIATRDASGALSISCQWPGGKPLSNEGASFRITMPDFANLDAATSNGAITVTGFGGSADLDTSNGRISVTNFAGSVDAETSNGAIELTDISGAVTADTSNGSIRITLSDDTSGPVRAESSNGAIVLKVGKNFAGEIDADTSNGGVTCDVPGATIVRKDRSSGLFRIGTGGGAHILDTSNGGIRIESR